SYQYLFLDAENQESLFQKMIGYNDRFEELVTPRGYGGWSGLGPTQNIIDDYEMQATGKPITDNTSGYIETGYATAAHPQGWYPNGTRNMYVGRDPRFYASILFNGQNWRGRRVELFRTGKDGYANARDYSTTGYNLKKYAGPDVNITQGIWAQKFCMYFRLGEIYLNYAEAINEAEGPDKAYWYINEIRQRVGMPDLPTGLNQEQMREKIRHERRIELAFEDGHRYFDTHRWKIAEQSEGIKIYGMNISRGSSFTDNQFYVRTLVEKRVFENKHYLFPIPQHEINKNENLKQAPGWITETNE
ncbi:MAG: RagB/SusD family nutrient uptake outer membrane protein, partial [Parabacteroides sp.]|nr:RagB/SusD family nutrient uptake outer membrane protein [Parabacteroides sp.]